MVMVVLFVDILMVIFFVWILGLELVLIRVGDVCWICMIIVIIVNVKKEGDFWMVIFKVVIVKIVVVMVDLVVVVFVVIFLEEVVGILGEEW